MHPPSSTVRRQPAAGQKEDISPTRGHVEKWASLRTLSQFIAPEARATFEDDLIAMQRETWDVAFGGHFSAGKSTTLNFLLERDLLPVSDLPETGVITALQAADEEGIWTERNGVREKRPCDCMTLVALGSLIGADGRYRERAISEARVDCRLVTAKIPPHVRWIDMPGLNDRAEMSEKARRAAASADLLVWVVNSRHLLPESEAAFLRQQLAGRAPDSVVFVVNCFLKVQTAQAFQKYVAEVLPNLVFRLKELYQSVGLRYEGQPIAYCPVLAPAVGCDFGHGALRQVITEFSTYSAEQKSRFRENRMRRWRETLGETLSGLIKQQEAAIQAFEVAEQKRVLTRQSEQAYFRNQLKLAAARISAEVHAQLDNWQRGASGRVAQPLQYSENFYGQALQSALGSVVSRAFGAHLPDLIAVAGSAIGGVHVINAAFDGLRQIPAIEVKVHVEPVEEVSPLKRAAMGTGGGFLLGPFGAVVGGVVGYATAKSKNEQLWLKAAQTNLLRTQMNLDSAAKLVLKSFDERLGAVVDSLGRSLPTITGRTPNTLEIKHLMRQRAMLETLK